MTIYSSALLKQVKQHLKNGGIIAYATEHCFGLGCDPSNYKAIDKIIRLKGRNKSKGLIVIAGNINQIKHMVEPLTSEVFDYWPGPYTLVVKARAKAIPPNLNGKHSRLAIRITAHKSVVQLCKYLNMALVSTSANYSGLRPAKTVAECLHQFGGRIMVLPGTTGHMRHPSVIIDWDSRKVLRGSITKEALCQKK